MPIRSDNGSYDNHRANELERFASHAHRVGEQHGQSEHESAHELSRQAMEHTSDSPQHSAVPTVGHGIIAFGHKEIEELAHQLWIERGSPQGSPEEDWYNAVQKLRSRKLT